MEINGIAHIFLTVSDFRKCQPFYAKLLAFLGLNEIINTEGMLYYVGGRTAVGIQQGDERDGHFVQSRVGLHHLSFRARERGDVDTLYALLKEIGATIVHPPEDGPWAPGYYSVLFEDPEGIRLEMNYVPGKGLLKE